jgi:sugar phosphate isomerase/epimerase
MERMMTNLSRRSFVQALCATGAATPLAAACQAMQGNAMPSGPFFASRNLPVGIQLYTLGDLMTKDMDGTLKQISQIGYKSVELAGYLGKTPKQLKASFDAAGLACTSAHVGMAKGSATEPKLLDDLSKVAADMHVIGAGHVICPAMAAPSDITIAPNPGEGFRVISRIVQAMTEDHWKRMAHQFNDIGRKLKAEGLAFGYHNHNFEFVKINGRTGFDIFMQETDPSLVTFELDVGWVAAGGYDPVELFNKYPDRYFLMHVKDVKPSTQANIELKMDPTEVGSGRLDWKSILPAAYKSGVRKYFLEQEAPFEKGRMEAAEIGYKYLSTLVT